jgi:dipeptidyl aminopeptidase/acylaminoacyl peptidase
MRRILTAFILFFATSALMVTAQQPAAAPSSAFTLTIDNIMRAPKLIGSAPSGVRWAPDSSKFFFSWQKPNEDRAQNYSVMRDGSDLRQITAEEARPAPTPTGRLDRARKRMLTAEGGNIVIYDVATNARRQLVKTAAVESNPRWVRNDTAVTFMRDGNLYLLLLDGSASTPAEVQLTDVVAATGEAQAPAQAAGARGGAAGRGGTGVGQGGRGGGDQALTDSQRILRQEEMNLIEYLKRQAELRQQGGRGGGGGGARGGRGGGPGGATGPAPEPIARFQPSARQTVTDLQLSADENYVFVGVSERPELAARNQDVPNYVTESAYPEMIPGRSNVGDAQSRRSLAILDLKQNKTLWADASAFAGNERPIKPGDAPVPRILNWGTPEWSDDGSQYVISLRTQDYKDRWFVTIDLPTGKAKILDAVHDDAWLREGSVSTGTGGGGGGFGGGGGGGVTWLPDNKRFLFLSEKDGWLHLYSLDVTAAKPAAKQLTSGKWEIDSARLSNDRTKVYFSSTEVHPGERHFYTMSVDGGPWTRITTMTGSNEVTVSPDEKSLAIIYSYSTKPPELYVMPFTAGAPAKQITTTPAEEWRTFKWIDPKVITYKARDGVDVYARLYTPEMIGAKRDPKRPAVIFVHGAGYLQNAHKYWSTYFREYMFNNLLASRGYVVLDPDYRASSGYGRDWRTAIYENMGGKDLEDVVDGAKFLVATEKVDAKRIGLYGGSYGGFITLMAMFKTPDAFAAGAALRPVTDWAHYNHGYTAQILNTPQNDLEAYKRSSPIYFADGLKGHLLICHGMVDTNVFFQDTVRLIQRLIELRKENWEVAPFPVENHSFTEETSWADEYKRILKLFEGDLRQPEPQATKPGKTGK